MNCRILPSFVSYSCGEDSPAVHWPKAGGHRCGGLAERGAAVKPPSARAMFEFEQCLNIGFGLPIVPEGRILSILPEVTIKRAVGEGGESCANSWCQSGCNFPRRPEQAQRSSGNYIPTRPLERSEEMSGVAGTYGHHVLMVPVCPSHPPQRSTLPFLADALKPESPPRPSPPRRSGGNRGPDIGRSCAGDRCPRGEASWRVDRGPLPRPSRRSSPTRRSRRR